MSCRLNNPVPGRSYLVVVEVEGYNGCGGPWTGALASAFGPLQSITTIQRR